MIQNWSTIERIAKYIKTARASAAIAKSMGLLEVKKIADATARKWEKLLAKFADSCKMVETYVVRYAYVVQWNTQRVDAVSPDAAVALVKAWLRHDVLRSASEIAGLRYQVESCHC